MSMTGRVRPYPMRAGAEPGEWLHADARLGRDMLEVDRVGDLIVLRSDAGVVITDAAGEIVGMDALDVSAGGLSRPGLSERFIIAAERLMRDTSQGMDRYAIRVISPESGALLASSDVLLPEAPDGLALLDGRIILSMRLGSVVYEAPVTGAP
jgi:hypothetical protein